MMRTAIRIPIRPKSMLDILSFEFMQRAFFAGICIAVIAPLIGSFLLLKRLSLLSDTLAHVSLAGVAIGLVTGIPALISATLASIVAGAGIDALRRSGKVFGDSVLAVFLSGSLALALIIFSSIRSANSSLVGYLFGSITTVSVQDVWWIFGVSFLTLAAIAIWYRSFFLVSLDEDLAHVAGIRVQRTTTLMIMLAALVVSLSSRVVGVLLIGALMVIPALAAMQLQLSFKTTLMLSVCVSVLSVVLGLTLSFYANLASGGTIVLIALTFFLLAFTLRQITNRWTKK